MFTPEQRDAIRARVLAMAQGDPRITGGALTGSTAHGGGDAWSDVDVAFGVAAASSLDAVLTDWTVWFERELGALHHWDLPAGLWIYRVFLLPDGLEVDVGLGPEADFRAKGPTFRLLFGAAQPLEPVSPPPASRYLIGLGWHHVFHARAAIERGLPWRAEYWISALRDNTLTLACVRLGETAAHARGADRLPVAITAPLAESLVRSLDAAELRRALDVATAGFLREVAAWDPALGSRLTPLLQEFGGHAPL
jgi:hypothetical protein